MELAIRDDIINKAKKAIALSEEGLKSYNTFTNTVQGLASPELVYPDTLIHVSLHEYNKMENTAKEVCTIVDETPIDKIFNDGRYQEDFRDIKKMCDLVRREELKKDITQMLEDISKSFKDYSPEVRKEKTDYILDKTKVYGNLFNKAKSTYSSILEDLKEE